MSRGQGRGDGVQERVASYRIRAERQGMQRVETMVPMDDANLIKDVARVLREDGEKAGELRRTIRAVIPTRRAETGAELLAFFREAPIEDEDLPIERDPSGGRTADFD